MYTQFFGNYLLSKNYVNKDQLFSAMQQLSSQHMKLGTLAIHAGLMTASEVDSVVVEQTHQDKRFGELAVTMGYLTEQQLNDLLNSQSPDYLLLGQILVDDNVLTNSDLENIIADYRLSNEILDLDIKIDVQATFTKLFDNLIFNSKETFSAYGRMYMELLFNNFVRFVGEDFTPFPADICKEFPTECCVAQEVFGDYSITTYMTMDTDTAIEFASRYVGDSFDESSIALIVIHLNFLFQLLRITIIRLLILRMLHTTSLLSILLELCTTFLKSKRFVKKNNLYVRPF